VQQRTLPRSNRTCSRRLRTSRYTDGANGGRAVHDRICMLIKSLFLRFIRAEVVADLVTTDCAWWESAGTMRKASAPRDKSCPQELFLALGFSSDQVGKLCRLLVGAHSNHRSTYTTASCYQPCLSACLQHEPCRFRRGKLHIVPT